MALFVFMRTVLHNRCDSLDQFHQRVRNKQLFPTTSVLRMWFLFLPFFRMCLLWTGWWKLAFLSQFSELGTFRRVSQGSKSLCSMIITPDESRLTAVVPKCWGRNTNDNFLSLRRRLLEVSYGQDLRLKQGQNLWNPCQKGYNADNTVGLFCPHRRFWPICPQLLRSHIFSL